MNKCLVTKLNGSSNNSELPRLGEMRMQILKVSNSTAHTKGFSINVNKVITLEIVSDGYFTDRTLTENKGKNITLNVGMNSIWVNGNSDVEIAILGKYSLRAINAFYEWDSDRTNGNHVKLDISDLKYSNALTSISLSKSQVSGDISNLNNLNALTYIHMPSTQISGDIANLNNLPALTVLILTSTQVSGDISNLNNLPALTTLTLASTQVSGDISNLKNLNKLISLTLSSTQVSGDIANLNNFTALTSMDLSNTQVSGDIANLNNLPALNSLSLYNLLNPLTGDIGQLSTLSNCTIIRLNYSTLTGDLAILSPKCRFASFAFDKGSVFTWSTRPSTAEIIAIEGSAKITNIDKMLQDQAECQVGFLLADPAMFKTIQIVGNRTSESDAAVATLQQKGYTVSITPA